MPADAELSRHDPDVPAWESLPADARRLAARMMEVFAGFLSHTDHHLGRVIDFLKETGQFDNTLIMLVSDNGASAEGGVQGTTNELQFFNNAPETLEESLRSIGELGGPDTFNHYPWGWTWAGNTPFRRWKRETYRGGTADPFVVHWPAGIPVRGAVRTQYAHIIDIVPTVLDVLGADAARDDPGRDPVTDARGELRAHVRRRGRAGAARGAVLRDARAPGHRPPRLAGGVPVARPVLRRGGPGVRRADHRGRPHRRWTRTTGSCTTSPRTPPRTTTWRTSTATGSSR